MDFNKNNKSESREDTLIERDAAPICDELLLEKSPICDSAPGEMSEQSQYNTLNVHNDNQRVLMQISNANSVHFGHVININSGKSEVCESKREDTSCSHKHFKTKTFNKKTTTIDIMMNSLDKPTHKIIDAIATHLGSGWKDVMRVLGFSDGQISQSELDNHLHGTKEVI
uniref:Uncharacterized protein n=1 Tax=Musca domestica TaxID=7370 RepID=A0A1I8MLB4_MUSDO